MALGAPPTSTQSLETATAQAFFMVEPDYFGFFPGGVPPVPVLVCRFNPKTLKLSGGAEWKTEETNLASKGIPKAQFQKQKPRTMSLQLLIDHFELPSGDVTVEVDILWDWTKPRDAVIGAWASTPHLRFQWGARRYFRCYIKSMSVEYTLFSRSGAPLRATVDLTLEETLDIFPTTNPTSGGPGGERSHRVGAGDTLHSIAQRYYGQPRMWRGIAAFNGVDDPLQVATGTVLGLPDFTVVEELS
jgi:hypothetical protein